MLKRKNKEEVNYENQVADLKRFRDIGDWFDFMDTRFNVTGHFVTQNVDGEHRKIPMIRGAYIDKNGVHHSRQFGHSMLEALYKANREPVPGQPVGEAIDTSPMKKSGTTETQIIKAPEAGKLSRDEAIEAHTQIVQVLDKKIDTEAVTKPVPLPATKLDTPKAAETMETQKQFTYVDVKAAYHSGYEYAQSTLRAQSVDRGYAKFMAKITGIRPSNKK